MLFMLGLTTGNYCCCSRRKRKVTLVSCKLKIVAVATKNAALEDIITYF